MALLESERQEARRIQARLAGQLEATRADKTIGTRQRQRQMARAVLAAREDMQALRSQSAARAEVDRRAAYGKLFGIKSADDRAYRDSLAARVAEGSLNATKARALYDLAVQRGDDLAVMALAELAWSHSGDELGGEAWHPMLDAYRSRSDAMENAMSVLVEISSPDKLVMMREKLSVEVLAPSDLPGNLEFLATDAETMDAGTPVGQNWQQSG
jgi:hypothetical protein